MIGVIPTIKNDSTYYNTFTMGACSIYHGFFSVYRAKLEPDRLTSLRLQQEYVIQI